jgi:hypothetical protein
MRELKVLKQVLLTLHTSSLEINVRRVTDVFTVLPYMVQTVTERAQTREHALDTLSACVTASVAKLRALPSIAAGCRRRRQLWLAPQGGHANESERREHDSRRPHAC